MDRAEIEAEVKARIGDWCEGRSWAWRLPLLLYLGWALIHHLADSRYQTILAPLNLGIHEMGHFAFRPFGQFLNIAGGTILELAAPIAAIVLFYRQDDYFAIACGFGWLGTALFGVATYCADARSMSLPLVAPGLGALGSGTPEMHDWHRMLSTLHLLPMDTLIAFFIRALATLSLLAALAGGAWLLWQMAQPKKLLS